MRAVRLLLAIGLVLTIASSAAANGVMHMYRNHPEYHRLQFKVITAKVVALCLVFGIGWLWFRLRRRWLACALFLLWLYWLPAVEQVGNPFGVVLFHPVDGPTGGDGDKYHSPPDGTPQVFLLGHIMAGVALSLAVVFGGIWLVRRWRALPKELLPAEQGSAG